tara:strand:+ start:237 stop:446 length:210 start_codon:yes stop_codon:yes gene_type:complete
LHNNNNIYILKNVLENNNKSYKSNDNKMIRLLALKKIYLEENDCSIMLIASAGLTNTEVKKETDITTEK